MNVVIALVYESSYDILHLLFVLLNVSLSCSHNLSTASPFRDMMS